MTVRRALKELDSNQAAAPILLRIIAQEVSNPKLSTYKSENALKVEICGNSDLFMVSSSYSQSRNEQVEEANFVASRTNKFNDQSSAVEIAVIVNDVVNRPPRFLQAT